MVRHYIIVSSSYTDGSRVALDITEATSLNPETILKIINVIKQNCGNDVPLSTHLIETDSTSWASVSEYDPFFENVKCAKSVEDFSDTIKKGRILTGLDVAAYILSKVKCTHLSLEKLVYFAYAEYLCEYSSRLFEDDIYAFAHGPVIKSVYETYKQSGYDYVTAPKQETYNKPLADVKELPAKSRILFAINGAEKLHSIDRTIKKYGDFSARYLVSLTHRNGSPWSYVDSSKQYQTISDELIKAHHHVESV